MLVLNVDKKLEQGEKNMLQVALLFQNEMVLQRDKKVTIWGNADAGAQVQITMQEQEVWTEADCNGKWEAFLGPFSTSFSEEMTITSGKEKLILKEVQVGEVWLAGGQSNMEFHMRYDADMEDEKMVCMNRNIRFFDYPKVSYIGQINETDYSKNYGFWRKAQPDQLERFSAVGYYFAKELQNKYKVPIGIIGCNWGGTPACAWMSKDAIMEGGGQIYLDEYETAIKNMDLEAYETGFRNNPESWKTDLLANPFSDMMMYGCTMEELGAKLMEMGVDLSKMNSSDFAPVMGPKYERRPSGLYEAMLKEVAPYTIRGVIWYQGETDGDCHPELYKTLFPALIKDWRKLWKDEFPFLFVQIAPLNRWMDCIGDSYVEIREAQQDTADNVPGTGMAVITDAGMESDIHPKKKQPVGHRLALLAQSKVYGEDILCEAPTLSEVKAEQGKLTLTFKNAGNGMYLAEEVAHGQKIGAEIFGGLQIIQDGQELDIGFMKARAEGEKVYIFGETIQAGVHTEVKIAKTGWYLVNLYNSASIPARPAEAEC